jgi:hypothetical protein
MSMRPHTWPIASWPDRVVAERVRGTVRGVSRALSDPAPLAGEKTMVRLGSLAVALVAVMAGSAAAQISGEYLEMRTCDIYTGPCFANAEIGLTGKEALLAWKIDEGSFRGVDLTGLKVVMAVNAADTLAYGGGMVFRPDPIKSVILVDARANEAQRQALIEFVKCRAGKLAGEVVRVEAVDIDMKLNHIDMAAELKAGNQVRLVTRKLSQSDCICTNETIFYPPLTDVDNYAAAFTLLGTVNTRGLASNWQAVNTRSAFLATFAQ